MTLILTIKYIKRTFFYFHLTLNKNIGFYLKNVNVYYIKL